MPTQSFTNISLTGYKNYQAKSFPFLERIIGISGDNGKGKTNLLDAIHYLCFTKSYFFKSDLVNVHFGGEGFRLEGALKDEISPQKIICIYRPAKKEFFLNDIGYEKFSHHIGLFPCVMIAPDDIEMITGGSEVRRKFLDTLICQVDSQYLQQLIIYNKVLLQRNSFLKNEAQKNNFNTGLLEVLDQQLIAPGNYIYNVRQSFSTQLFPLIRQFYQSISGNNETIDIEYFSQIKEQTFDKILLESRSKDKLLQRTNAGIHKDELLFSLNENIFKSTASQGQRKSLLFACKLAEFEIIKKVKGFPPILLLDDVFEKLDENRMNNLLDFVCGENNGQVFITDTHKDRLVGSLTKFGAFQIIDLNNI
ncbi:MAG: DNA replication and repair protein RecF [Ginsengibacter sp.]